MQKAAGIIAVLTLILGLTATTFAQVQGCAAALGSDPDVSEIISLDKAILRNGGHLLILPVNDTVEGFSWQSLQVSRL